MLYSGITSINGQIDAQKPLTLTTLPIEHSAKPHQAAQEFANGEDRDNLALFDNQGEQQMSSLGGNAENVEVPLSVRSFSNELETSDHTAEQGTHPNTQAESPRAGLRAPEKIPVNKKNYLYRKRPLINREERPKLEANLLTLGFSKKQIIQIYGDDAGTLTMQTILEHSDFLQKAELSIEQIIKIANYQAGGLAIRALVEHWDFLNNAGFSIEQTINIANLKNSAAAIEAVVKHYDFLTKVGFLTQQIVTIVRKSGGATILKTIVNHWDDLKEARVSIEEIVDMACRQCDSARAFEDAVKNLKTNPNTQAESLSAGLRAPDKMPVNRKISVYVRRTPITAEERTKLEANLLTLGFSEIQILQGCIDSPGILAMQAIVEHWDFLEKAGFLREQIFKIASHKGGASAIQALVKHCNFLKNAEFSIEHIFNIAMRPGGATAIQTVVDCCAFLKDAEFSIEQIVKIASSRLGGAKAIQAVVKHYAFLKREGLLIEKIVETVCKQPGGVPALENAVKKLQSKQHPSQKVQSHPLHAGGEFTLAVLL